MTTNTLATAYDIAAFYGSAKRPTNGNHMIKCPVHEVHEGQGLNLSVKDAPDGGLLLNCFSRSCSFNAILDAFRRDGLTVKREWTYPNGSKIVRRTDSASIPKGRHFKESDSQSVKNVPLLVRGDSPGALIVITEGESDADAILSADLDGVAATTFPGGAGSAGDADYSAVKGRRVCVWADGDEEGLKAQQEAALASMKAGAVSVELVLFVGKMGDGKGAADCTPSFIKDNIEARKPFDDSVAARLLDSLDAEPPARLVWTPLKDILATPPAHWLIEGLLAAGSVNLMYGAPKAGKTMFILAMLKAASVGEAFLGFPLEQMASWLISEQSENSLAPQLRTLRVEEGADISVALWRHQPAFDSPEAFADAIYIEFCQAKKRPAIVVIDTLSTFIDLKDSNDYSQVQAQLSPIVQMGQDIGAMEGTATLLTHQSRKSSGEGSDSVLGSRKVAAMVDTLLKLTIVPRGDGMRKLSVQSRFGIGELGDDVAITLELPAGEYRLVNASVEMDGDILAIVEAGATSNPEIREKLAGIDGAEVETRLVGRRLAALVKKNQLIRTGNGKAIRYTLPNDQPTDHL